MTDAKRLLSEATPLPWRFEDDEYLHAPTEDLPHYGTQLNWDTEGLGGVWRNDYDKELIVYAVNHLPDYLAAVEALERLVTAAEYAALQTKYTLGPLLRTHPETKGTPMALEVRLTEALEPARAALARLRDEVPA